MNDLPSSIESAIEQRLAEDRENAALAAQQAKARQEERSAEMVLRSTHHRALVSHIRIELKELARLLADRSVPQDLCFDITEVNRTTHRNRPPVSWIRGEYEDRVTTSVVATIKLWKLETFSLGGGGGSGWDGEPGPELGYEGGTGLALNGDYISWDKRSGRPQLREIVSDNDLVPWDKVDTTSAVNANPIVADWHKKIVEWGVRLIGKSAG